MSQDAVLLEVDRGVAVVTLNRPERLNALDPGAGRRLEEVFVQVANDEAVRVVVLTGAGRGFCAGADISPASRKEGNRLQDAPGTPHPVLDGVSRAPLELRYRYTSPGVIPQPVIAAVNGPCVGIGFALAVASDLRFASQDAVFAANFGRRGLTAEAGLAWSLTRLVGAGPATDLLISARNFDAGEALRLNFVSDVTPPGGVLERAMAYARDVADNVSPRSTRIIKQQIRMALQQSQADALTLSYLEVLRSLPTEDAKEGVVSFGERRAPNFTGR